MNVTKSMNGLWVVAILLGLTTTAYGQVIPIDDFDDGNDDGWSHVDTTIGQAWGPGIYDASSVRTCCKGPHLRPRITHPMGC